jgi:hypothetical protein
VAEPDLLKTLAGEPGPQYENDAATGHESLGGRNKALYATLKDALGTVVNPATQETLADLLAELQAHAQGTDADPVKTSLTGSTVPDAQSLPVHSVGNTVDQFLDDIVVTAGSSTSKQYSDLENYKSYAIVATVTVSSPFRIRAFHSTAVMTNTHSDEVTGTASHQGLTGTVKSARLLAQITNQDTVDRTYDSSVKLFRN